MRFAFFRIFSHIFLFLLLFSFIFYLSLYPPPSLSLLHKVRGKWRVFLDAAKEQQELSGTRFINNTCMLCKSLLGMFASSHGLAGSEISNASYVIASRGEMAEAIGFSVE